VAKLQAIANALQLSLDEYLSRFAELVALPRLNGQEKAEALTPFEMVEDLIGSVDSNERASIKTKRHPSLEMDFGAYLIEKHNKEQRRFFALQKIAAQQGVTADQWVGQNFPNGCDSHGRSLKEFLDTLP
jgi:hypothetical protein